MLLATNICVAKQKKTPTRWLIFNISNILSHSRLYIAADTLQLISLCFIFLLQINLYTYKHTSMCGLFKFRIKLALKYFFFCVHLLQALGWRPTEIPESTNGTTCLRVRTPTAILLSGCHGARLSNTDWNTFLKCRQQRSKASSTNNNNINVSNKCNNHKRSEERQNEYLWTACVVAEVARDS